MGSDLLVGLYELRWIWNGRKIFKDGKIERAYVTTQADSLYERYLQGTRFFAQHSILWMAILATSGHNYLDILIWMGIVSVIAFYSRNRISYTTIIRGLSQGMHGGEILAQPCCFLGFYLSALQFGKMAELADTPGFATLGSSLLPHDDLDISSKAIPRYAELATLCLQANGTALDSASPELLRTCTEGFAALAASSVAFLGLFTFALMTYFFRNMLMECFLLTPFLNGIVLASPLIVYFTALVKLQVLHSWSGFISWSWPLIPMIFQTFRHQRSQIMHEVASRSAFVKETTTNKILETTRNIVYDQNLKLNELEKMINLTEEQNELVMGMMEGFGDKTLQVAGFKIDVEEEVQFAKKIGEGSFGIVYVGKFRGMQVAVKQLISDHVDEENLDRFKAEIMLMSQLHHPNLAQMIGASWEPPNLAIVLEFCAKGDVQAVLHKGGWDRTGPKTRVRWIQQIARGMAYLHTREVPVMHRDLKPENVLVTEFDQAKISDFGESRTLQKGDEGNLTQVGTPYYMAPEIIRGDDYDQSCDAFSFALLTLSLMVGDGNPKVWLDESGALREGRELTASAKAKLRSGQVITRHAKGWRADLSALGLPKELAVLIEAAWHHVPAERPSFEDIAEFAETLHEDMFAGLTTRPNKLGSTD